MRKSLVAALVVCLIPALAMAGAPGTSLTNPGNGPVIPNQIVVPAPVSNVGDLVFYDNAGTYDAGPGSGQLLENLEGAANNCTITGFTGPLSSAGAGPYAPGEVLPGITIHTVTYTAGNTNLVTIPAGFNGNPSCMVAGNYFVDVPTYRAAGASAIGGMLQSHFSSGQCQIDVKDTNGTTTIGTTTVSCTNAGAFFGVNRTNGQIGGMNVFSLSNQAEGADDIRFGVPEPTTMVLLAGGALALVRRRR